MEQKRKKGRPRKEETVLINFRVPISQREQCKDAARSAIKKIVENKWLNVLQLINNLYIYINKQQRYENRNNIQNC